METRKTIVIIDDSGALLNRLQQLFSADSDIRIVASTSAKDDWADKLHVDDYLIIINEDGLKTSMKQLVDNIKHRFLYCITPIAISTENKRVLEADNMMAEPIMTYIPMLKLRDSVSLHEQLRNIVETFDSARNLNSLTGLPANNIIVKQIQADIDSGKDFAMMYVDLDNFKEYNEYYGFHQGDKVLLFLSNIIYTTFREMGSDEDFIGHVGGDDFMLFVHDKSKIKAMGEHIIKRFDAKIRDFYAACDLKNDYIEVRNRTGEMEKINIMGISIIVIDGEKIRATTPDQLYINMMTEKKKAKMIKGSVML